MIIKCSRCYTNYRIDPSQLKPFGKKVKCTKCSNVWFETYREEKEEIIIPDAIPSNSSLPVVVTNYIPIWLKFLPVMFFCMIIMSSTFFYQKEIVKAYPGLNEFYDLIGIPDTEDLKLEDIAVKYRNNTAEISGIIKNISSQKRITPKIIITTSGDQGYSNSINIIDTQKSYIQAYKTKHFSKIIYGIPKDAEYITVSLGDKFDIFSLNFN
ncbi:MAG: zinc-ribbon domain-containing protein [Rickettsiales bacterium]